MKFKFGFKQISIIYLVVGLFAAGLIMKDYNSCENDNSSSSSVNAGFSIIYGGVLFWPLTLPGMITMLDRHEGKFCL